MIDKDNLKIDNYYLFKLLPSAGTAPKTYGRLTGKTSMTCSQYFSEYAIIDKYLKEYNMTLRDFYENVNDEVEILMVHPMTKFDPPELDKEPIYIPISLVDFQSSEDLLTSNIYNFTIKNIKRYFEMETEKDNYSKNAIQKLSKILNNEELFVSENIVIEIEVNEEIKTRTEVIKDKRYQKQVISDKTNALVSRMQFEETQYAEYAKARDEYRAGLKRFQEDTAELETMKQEWSEKFKEIDELNVIMDKKEERLRAIYDELKLYADDMGKPMPPYDQLVPQSSK